MAVQSVYYLDTIHVGDGRDDVENYQSILNSVSLLSRVQMRLAGEISVIARDLRV